MDLRRLAQCYRCRRLFTPRGHERYCPQCDAERSAVTEAFWEDWRPFLIVVGGIGLLMLLSGEKGIPTLAACALVAAWYRAVRR